MGIASPVIGWLFDRWGPRFLGIAGVSLTALSFVLMSNIDSIVDLQVAFSLMGLGGSAATFLLLNSVVSLWFRAKLGRALAISQTGYGIGGLLAPVFVLMIGALGWRAAAQLIGLGVFVLGVPMCFILKHRPERYGLKPDGVVDPVESRDNTDGATRQRRARPHERSVEFTAHEAIRTWAFWLILIVLTLSSGITIIVFSHQIRAMIDYGFKPEVAGTIAGSTALIGVAGRFAMGWLGELYSSRFLLPVALLVQTAGVFMLSRITPSAVLAIVLFVALFGMGQSAIFLLSPLIQKEYFGTTAFGTIQGLIIGPSMIVAAAAPVPVGSYVDSFGTYRPVFALASGLGVILAFAMLLSRHPQPRAEDTKVDSGGQGRWVEATTNEAPRGG